MMRGLKLILEFVGKFQTDSLPGNKNIVEEKRQLL